MKYEIPEAVNELSFLSPITLQQVAIWSEVGIQNAMTWTRELWVEVDTLLLRNDPVLASIVQHAVELPRENGLERIGKLIQVFRLKPSVPSAFSVGAFFAKGGTSLLYHMTERSDLLIKLGGGRLPNEALAMVEIEMLGIPTVYVKKTQVNKRHVLILQKIDGIGSKEIIGRLRAPIKPPQNTEVVTQKTCHDLELIWQKLQTHGANIGDFQFIIRRSDGAVFVNDPVSFVQNTRRGPSGNILQIIHRFKKILKMQTILGKEQEKS